MRGARAILACLLGALGSNPEPVAAHPHEYVNASGDALIICDAKLGFGIGGACIEPGHLEEDAVVIELRADDFGTASGFYCQDLDANLICGDPSMAEPSQAFCQEMELVAAINWDPGYPVHVLVDFVYGNLLSSACTILYSGSTSGRLDHG